MKNFLICPFCKSTLSGFNFQDINCITCGRTFRQENGIPLLRNTNPKFYWGVNQKKMQEMLANSEKCRWEDAMHNLIDVLPLKEADLLWRRTFWPVRPALQSLMFIKKSDVVLEIGPGWGAIALFVTENCYRYVAMDQLFTHLQWIKELAQAKNISNIDFVCSGNAPYLPFRSNYFDKVIMNGVLEWVASNTEGNPAKVQQRFMNEVSRILKPHGQVYVGIENRINYKYFLGSPEGHIRMKYGSLLPRFVTRLYLKLMRNQDFREYTYTLLGYRKLLLKSGFVHRRYYSTCPHYSGIRRIYPVGLNISDSKKRPWKKLLSHERFSKLRYSLFSHCFGFVGSKEDDGISNLVEWVLKEIQRNTHIKEPNLIDALCKITSTGKAVVLLEELGKRYWVSIGLTNYTRRSIEKNLRAVEFFKEQRMMPDGFVKVLPKPVFVGSWEEYKYVVEEYAEGDNGYKWCCDSEKRERFNEEVYDFILSLTKSSPFIKLIGDDYERLVVQPVDNFKNWFSTKEYVEKYQEWLKKCKEWLEQSLKGAKLPLVPRHGDLVPSNCIVDNGRLSAVLDWELFEERGLPALDMLIFTSNSYRPQVKEDYKKKGLDPNSFAFHGYPEMFLNGLFRKWMERYMSDTGIDLELYEPLLFMWWMTYMNDMLEIHQFNPYWKRLRASAKSDAWQKRIKPKGRVDCTYGVGDAR